MYDGLEYAGGVFPSAKRAGSSGEAMSSEPI
jgi:hypothetical protein